MQFCVKQIGTLKERLGVLTNSKTPDKIIETPTSALFTKGGSVVHLTADTVARVFTNPQLLWVPLSTSIQLESGAKAQGEGLSKFVGLPQHMTCLTFSDMNEKTPAGHFENQFVPLWSRNGKIKFSAQRYMDVMNVFKPDIIVALADNRITPTEGHKRVIKAVERTGKLFEECVTRYKASIEYRHSSLIGVIVGVSHVKEFELCLKRLLLHKDSLLGIVFSGLISGGDESVHMSVEDVEPLFKLVGESTPPEMLRILEGCWNPVVVMAAIEHGWDLFDGSYPVWLTDKGHALCFLFNDAPSEELCILDLNNKKYKSDFRPLLAECECLACRKHTRAYIQHLLNTREMLALVLLSIHNLHHYNAMFRACHGHIASGTFNVFKTIITKQYNLYSAATAESAPIETKINEELQETIQQKKKKCITVCPNGTSNGFSKNSS